ncbi:translocation protein S66 [Pleurotus ostreatus]|uniref:Translocation protein S66 n=1 Tax=Pleurotus ostreatus TaxID=5322 RepID=A0A8H7DVL2_PLEOS|nr:translocation protein S66 [Pleurotus ostreatus]KAF7440434.1 translocation protein S66 [Pleurotus ostreatus]KAJ8700237.1 Translocation protein S66 [Pleurotus ostreatus]
MASILVPIAYVIIVFGGLYVFSYFYRNYTASKYVEPYFPPHHERNLYVTLLGKSDPPVSDALLKSALVRRAMADVHRVIRLREDKPALQNLLQKGSIGDDLWNSLLAAEKELEAEIMEVVQEANAYVEGWGQVIFPTANEMIANERMRQLFESTNETRTAKEIKYGVKSKSVATSSVPSSPALTSPSPSLLTPTTPKTPNGLAPPSKAESVASSDGEAPDSPNMSRKSAKKNKKRK